MYTIAGITGQVGGAAARVLLDAGEQVRGIVRDREKAAPWIARGCEVVVTTITDSAGLSEAFAGADAVFVMVPPIYDPQPGFPEVPPMVEAITAAVEAARPGRVVVLSTVGAHVQRPNLLNLLTRFEGGLSTLPVPVAFVRAAWFMENASWDVASAKAGRIGSFLQPADHPVPMVATTDIGRVIAATLRERWKGIRTIELEGPRRYSAEDVRSAFERALGHPVAMDLIPREGWEASFRGQGMRNPQSRIQMLDGFNEGWIDFEGNGHTERRSAQTTLDEVIAGLVARG